MAADDHVNVDFEFSVTQNAAAIPGISSGGKDDCTVNEDTDNEMPSGKKVLTDKITNPSGGSLPAWGCESPGQKAGTHTDTPTNTGSYTINAGMTDNKENGKACMKKGDSATCSCAINSAHNQTGVITPITGSCTIEIVDGGQSDCQGS